MIIITYISTVISLLLFAAHFLRAGEHGLVASVLLLCFMLIYKKKWILNITSLVLIYSSINWIITAFNIYSIRTSIGQDSTRMFIILGLVSLIALLSALLLQAKKTASLYRKSDNDIGITISFIVTVSLTSIAFIKVSFPILLFERFFETYGWLQVFLLGVYSSYVTEKMLDISKSSKIRRRIWLIFSIVFFAQLTLGLAGYEIFLMTGKLHLPVPAIILLGPLYRLEISFMVILFLSSMVLVGPAWCSHLCYLGIWDNFSADAKSKPHKVGFNVWLIRFMIFAITVITALTLNFAGISPITATFAGLLFGIIGIIVMVVYSLKSGNMLHCTVYCPIGLLAVLFGKISPFRIRINNECDNCMKCHFVCRFNALNYKDIQQRKPNLNCTLCGDCISPCEHSAINYRFWGFSPKLSRVIFVVAIVSIHSIFLGLGRI